MVVLRRVGKVDVNVRVDGDLASRRPVLLVHGMGGDHTTWREVARELRRRGSSVVAMDLRGHGRSGRSNDYRLDSFGDDIRFVADELRLGEFDVVAHSLGAHSALRSAMAMPDRIGRMVLEEPPPMPRDGDDLAENIEPTATLGERVRGVAELIRQPMPYVRFDRTLPEAVLPQFKIAEPQWWARLGEIRPATLIVSGGARSFLPPHHLRDLAAALPAGRFVTIDAGHSVHRVRPAEFIGQVVGHLRLTD